MPKIYIYYSLVDFKAEKEEYYEMLSEFLYTSLL